MDYKPSNNPTARFQWNRTSSQVELLDNTTHPVRRSHNTATFKRPMATVDHLVHRGSVNKCSSQVEFASEGEQEEWYSTTQLASPGVVYSKERLPIRTGSKVQMGRERPDYMTSTLGAYASNARIHPPTCPGRTAWNRTHSKVPLGGESEPMMTTSGSMHTNLLPLIYGNDGTTPTRFSKAASVMRLSQKAALADPNLTESTPARPADSDSFRATSKNGQILKGSINKCASIVDINNSLEHSDGGFITHNSVNYSTPGKDALWRGPGPHCRTRSEWVPGSNAPDFGTTTEMFFNGENGDDAISKRFSWKRTASNVKLNSGETVLPNPHSASTHTYMDNTVGERVIRGTVNKCASTIKLTQ